MLEKKDVVVLAAERSYRRRYVVQALSGVEKHDFDGLRLTEREISLLIDKYVEYGVVGLSSAIRKRKELTPELVNDPIGVACCRILNDFRPLDNIVSELLQDSDVSSRERYLMAALAEHCYRGGARYSVLAAAVDSVGLLEQIRSDHPLPLSFFNDGSNSFVVPENATLANRILSVFAQEEGERLLDIFVALANTIAPRVNRDAIRRRSPEARLAGRLFDYDSVAKVFLQDSALEFYVRTQDAWQWNSRYWGQVALLKLSIFYRTGDRESLVLAVQHARHAVSIETHPFTLTTLGQTLFAEMECEGYSASASYEEALEVLRNAIELERQWGRKAIQPFIAVLRGSLRFLELRGSLSMDQIKMLRSLIEQAVREFPRDYEVREVVKKLDGVLRQASAENSGA